MKNLVDNLNKLIGQSVRVYRNLHKRCFSVQAKNSKGNWVVIGHVTQLVLRDVTFKVSQAGRERVLREKSKNVHAYVYGTVDAINVGDMNSPCKDFVRYNPYQAGYFWWGSVPGKCRATRSDIAWLHSGATVVAAV